MKSLEHQGIAKESGKVFFTHTDTQTHTHTKVAAAAATAIGNSLFRIAYFIVAQGCPYTDFSYLVELGKLNEVKFVPSGSYENETASKDFISFYSKSIFDAYIRDKIDRANFISVLCDGFTNSGVVEKECIYIRFIDPDTFKIKVPFFALRDVPSQDAQGIYSAIKSASKDANLEHLLIITDVALVNTGHGSN